jgi:type 1 glutamine amidotransferase
MKKALIFYGGWEGHEPAQTSERFEKVLLDLGYEVDRVNGTDCLSSLEKLLTYDLIVPCVTMGSIDREHEKNICDAIASGVGLAGWHGGMCDAFRNSTEWQFMTGAQWVSHPGNDGVRYTVNIVSNSPIVDGIDDFEVLSEQYYLHVDPAVKVLATTRFPIADGRHTPNGTVEMPVAFTKRWGEGKVFYCSLGHNDDLFKKSPSAELLITRGMLWVTR